MAGRSHQIYTLLLNGCIELWHQLTDGKPGMRFVLTAVRLTRLPFQHRAHDLPQTFPSEFRSEKNNQLTKQFSLNLNLISNLKSWITIFLRQNSGRRLKIPDVEESDGRIWKSDGKLSVRFSVRIKQGRRLGSRYPWWGLNRNPFTLLNTTRQQFPLVPG